MVYHMYNILIPPFLCNIITVAHILYLTGFLRICRFPRESKWLFKMYYTHIHIHIRNVYCYCYWNVLSQLKTYMLYIFENIYEPVQLLIYNSSMQVLNKVSLENIFSNANRKEAICSLSFQKEHVCKSLCFSIIYFHELILPLIPCHKTLLHTFKEQISIQDNLGFEYE